MSIYRSIYESIYGSTYGKYIVSMEDENHVGLSALFRDEDGHVSLSGKNAEGEHVQIILDAGDAILLHSYLSSRLEHFREWLSEEEIESIGHKIKQDHEYGE